jgi:transcriptional regulator
MKRYSFATIVTVKDNYQSATHLPFVIEQHDDKIILSSHCSVANPQWKELTDHQVLVIFTEPHAYISPKNYEKELNVPTWNYIAVHAYGKAQIKNDDQYKFGMLEKMISLYEENYMQQWKKLPDEYKTNMLKGIVAFEIEVKELQGKEKLSQNKTEKEKHTIIESLSKSELESERTIAEYMKKRFEI